MVAFRDLKVSQDIAKWAELGKFEQEFIVYGCCYLRDGQRYYHIGDQLVEVSRFAQARLLEGICTTPVVEWLNRVLVPSGLQDEYANISKLQLAQRMQQLYPQDVLSKFHTLAQTPPNDSAKPILTQLQHTMIACFDQKLIELAEGLALLAFQQKKITHESYDAFHDWVEDRYLQMADDVVIKKDIQRTLYAFSYRTKDGTVRYYCNAYESEAYKRHNALMCQGSYCTPIIRETFYYDQMPNMAEERKKYLKQLERWMDDEYWQIIDAICACPSVIGATEMCELKNSITGEKALEDLFGYYSTQWHI